MMKKLKQTLWMLTAVFMLMGLSAPGLLMVSAQPGNGRSGNDQQITGNYSEETILVKFKPGTPAQAKRVVTAEEKLQEVGVVSKIDVRIMKVPAGKTVEEMVTILNRNPNIEFAEPDFEAQTMLTPNDPYFANWQSGLKRMDAEAAWELSLGSSSVPVAILDTGVNSGHEDLAGRVMAGYNFVSNNRDASDDHGHGTRVAGILSANVDNGKGIAGVTWKNPIMPVKVMGSSGYGNYSDIANGIIFAADNGARVINMSLGAASKSLSLENAINYAYNKGVVLVAAAGNSNTAVFYPAAYPNVIAVAAVDGGDVKASYSNFGPEISVAAPGSTLSTLMNGSYGNSSGTSFAAPFVAGLAGLLMSEDTSLSPAQVQHYIEQGAIDLGASGWDQYYGHGRINLANSLAFVTEAKPVQPIDVEPPTITLFGEFKVTITQGEHYDDAGATAYDQIDGDLTNNISVINPVDTNVPNTYYVRYNVSDTAGNQAKEVVRTVVVEPAPTPEPIIEPVDEPVEEQPIEQEPVKEEPVEELPEPQTFNLSGHVDLRKGNDTAYHRLNITRVGDLDALLSWNAGNTNLDLTLMSPDGHIIDQSSSATKQNLSESVSGNISQTGNYTLMVIAVEGKSNYSLTVTVK